MSDHKCAEMLLRAAERDVLTLRNMTAEAPDESFGFHVQQAAEKAFKAWLAALGETYPLTHSLQVLLRLLAAKGVATAPFEGLADFTPYAVEFRYEGVGADAEPIDREAALARLVILLDRVRRQVEGASRG